MKLNESVVLVTGASRGLGLEVAKAYAQGGAKLVIAARNQSDLDAAATELGRQTQVVALALDVSQDAERLVEAGLERFGRIDVLVNNASELGPSPMPQIVGLWRPSCEYANAGDARRPRRRRGEAG